jgi:hypothetical protein
MRKITVEIESADDVKVTAKSLQDKWNYNLKEEDKIKVKEISFNSVFSADAVHHELDLEFVKQQGGIPQDNEN